MFVRMRWFLLGVLASIGMMAYAADRLRRTRERLTPSNVGRVAAHGVAGFLDAAADRITPAAQSR